jgi:hypothetical protein
LAEGNVRRPERRLASYRSREAGTLVFSDELVDKRRQLGKVEKSLAVDVEGAANGEAIAA